MNFHAVKNVIEIESQLLFISPKFDVFRPWNPLG
jgi:hypothetical protein